MTGMIEPDKLRQIVRQLKWPEEKDRQKSALSNLMFQYAIEKKNRSEARIVAEKADILEISDDDLDEMDKDSPDISASKLPAVLGRGKSRASKQTAVEREAIAAPCSLTTSSKTASDLSIKSMDLTQISRQSAVLQSVDISQTSAPPGDLPSRNRMMVSILRSSPNRSVTFTGSSGNHESDLQRKSENSPTALTIDLTKDEDSVPLGQKDLSMPHPIDKASVSKHHTAEKSNLTQSHLGMFQNLQIPPAVLKDWLEKRKIQHPKSSLESYHILSDSIQPKMQKEGSAQEGEGNNLPLLNTLLPHGAMVVDKVSRNVGGSVDGGVGECVGGDVGGSVDGGVGGCVGGNVGGDVGGSVDGGVGGCVGGSVGAGVGGSVGGSVGGGVGGNVGCNVGVDVDGDVSGGVGGGVGGDVGVGVGGGVGGDVQDIDNLIIIIEKGSRSDNDEDACSTGSIINIGDAEMDQSVKNVDEMSENVDEPKYPKNSSTGIKIFKTNTVKDSDCSDVPVSPTVIHVYDTDNDNDRDISSGVNNALRAQSHEQSLHVRYFNLIANLRWLSLGTKVTSDLFCDKEWLGVGVNAMDEHKTSGHKCDKILMKGQNKVDEISESWNVRFDELITELQWIMTDNGACEACEENIPANSLMPVPSQELIKKDKKLLEYLRTARREMVRRTQAMQ